MTDRYFLDGDCASRSNETQALVERLIRWASFRRASPTKETMSQAPLSVSAKRINRRRS